MCNGTFDMPCDLFPARPYWVVHCSWKEVRDYIIQRRNAIRGTDITAEELMGSS